MDELVPLYKPKGVPSGICALKSEAHKFGWWHGTVHVWMLAGRNKILFQKRSPKKQVYPGLWDVSVAGHINGWEDPLDAAVREIREELRLKIDGKDLRFIGTFPAEVFHSDSRIIDREHQRAYLYTQTVEWEHITPDPEEVSELSTFPYSFFDLGAVSGFVPHAPDYLKAVAACIRKVFP